MFNGFEYKVEVVAFNDYGVSSKSDAVFAAPDSSLADDCTIFTPPGDSAACEALGYPCGGLMYTGTGACCEGACADVNGWLSLCVRT